MLANLAGVNINGAGRVMSRDPLQPFLGRLLVENVKSVYKQSCRHGLCYYHVTSDNKHNAPTN
jgi:hypothetical protein